MLQLSFCGSYLEYASAVLGSKSGRRFTQPSQLFPVALPRWPTTTTKAPWCFPSSPAASRQTGSRPSHNSAGQHRVTIGFSHRSQAQSTIWAGDAAGRWPAVLDYRCHDGNDGRPTRLAKATRRKKPPWHGTAASKRSRPPGSQGWASGKQTTVTLPYRTSVGISLE